jgi:hypothetical protein
MPYKSALKSIFSTVLPSGILEDMETKKAKVFTGVLLFIGIIAIGAVVFNFVRLYTSMPSRSEVLDFANNALFDTQEVGEPIEGSLVPVTDGEIDTENGTPTTLPTAADAPANDEVVRHDWLTAGQRAMLETFGIDESALPATLTPELEACFDAKIGEVRVEAIKAGDTPTMVEGMKAIACL